MSEIERQVRMGAKLLGVEITGVDGLFTLHAPAFRLFARSNSVSFHFTEWSVALVAIQTLKPWGIPQHMGAIMDTLEKALVMRSTDVGD